jgi:hypothetical protein
MRKLYFLFLLLFISNKGIAQDKLLEILPLKEGKVTYIDVIELQGVSKEELYNRVKHWFAFTYNSGKDVIQLDDKEKGEIIGKGCFKEKWMIRFYFSQNVNVWKTIKIQIRENQYRYEISNFRMKIYDPFSQYASLTDVGIPLEDWNKGHDLNNLRFYPKIDNQVIAIINSLDKAMKNKIDDGW